MLDEILFGRTRAAVLRELYVNPDRRISFNELVRRLKSGPGAVSRELATLTSAGLISEHREGNQRFVSACVSSPLYPELKAFITKASGAREFIREALGDEARLEKLLSTEETQHGKKNKSRQSHKRSKARATRR